jgi:hypothetical protein
LVLIEEARTIIGWDNIKDNIRIEDNNRKAHDGSTSCNPLRNLDDGEIVTLKIMYEKYTPIIKLLFVAMTVLQVLWDVMLVSTMLYYHRMAEKVIAGIIAIITWYFTYKFWYVSKDTLPDAPGQCSFKYQQKAATSASITRKSSLLGSRSTTGAKTSPSPSATGVPKFMGNPIYKSSAQRDELITENLLPQQGKYDFQPPLSKF